MRIVHLNALPSPDAVDGVNSVIWSLATEQVRQGHEVGLVFGGGQGGAQAASARAISPLEVRGGLRAYRAELSAHLTQFRPDVVHVHSAFSPRIAQATAVARGLGIPVVTTPHGGFHPTVLRRRPWRKRAYLNLVEQRRLRMSSAITVLTPAEAAHLRKVSPRLADRLVVVPVPVAAPADLAPRRSVDGPVVFLGRYDVQHKGLDLWIDLAARFPAHDFQLYGSGPDRSWLEDQCPANVTVNDPVLGPDKWAVLAAAGLYLQTSRSDAHPISVVEAMFAGVPLALTETIDLAPMVSEQDLGVVLPVGVDAAALILGQVLGDHRALERWARRASAFARDNLTPEVVAARYVDVYERTQDPSYLESASGP